jgi:hypothetical protein
MNWSESSNADNRACLLYEYGCHEGNYGMLNILRGQRVKERRGE